MIVRGNALYKSFLELFRVFQRVFLKKHYTLGDSEFELQTLSLVAALEEFDQLWTRYEDRYVHELMIIECQSRRFIADGIAADAALTGLEVSAKQSGEFTLNPVKKGVLTQANVALCKVIAKINSVANFEGHGRDDLGVDILQAASDVLLKVTACESQNLRRLAEKILGSYLGLRQLLRRYKENIEVVDPQLRNNPDLVEALMEYEKNWEKGRIYLLNNKRCDQLIFFTNVIEGLCEKYPAFKENLECCDAEVFVQIPMVMLLKRVDKEDSDICDVFLPQIMESESSAFQMFGQLRTDLLKLNDRFSVLREKIQNVRRTSGGSMGMGGFGPFASATTDRTGQAYKTLLKANKGSDAQKTAPKKLSFDFYNFLETRILSEDYARQREAPGLGEEETELLAKNVLNLRHLSIEMQRFNPMEWNAFLDIAISK